MNSHDLFDIIGQTPDRADVLLNAPVRPVLADPQLRGG